MNCPNCGADLPEGAQFCSICQQPIAGPAGASVNDQLFNAAPTYDAAPKKKTPVVGIVIGVVAALAIAFVLVFFVLGARYNGTYMLESMSYGGMTMTASDLGMDDIGLKVSFGKCEFVGGESLGLDAYGKSKIKFTSDSVTITDSDGTEATGDFDGSSFTLEIEGVEMTFSK